VEQTTNLKEFATAKAVVFSQIEELPTALSEHTVRLRSCVERLFDHAAKRLDDDRIFISTGDIDAMWLRDSSFQIKPLLRFSNSEPVADFLCGVIRSQAFFISIDPYANAFNSSENDNCWQKDFEDQSPWVFERKWEIDSLASFLDVSLGLFESTNSAKHMDSAWWNAVERVISVFEDEQHHDPQSYVFMRPNAPRHDYLYPDGVGRPFANCGLIWSAFRPSDDACELPFNIAQNAYAAAQLERLAKVAEEPLAIRSLKIAGEIRSAISQRATFDCRYAYEIDGLGNYVNMDDANIPSLLSLPYLGFCAKDDETYMKTRQYVLSNKNPWFFSGSEVSHIGSPHTGNDRVWPLAMAMEIITSQDIALEKLNSLAEIAKNSDGLHESVSIDDTKDFTREWFSWAEMTYVDAVFTTVEKLAT
jgi:meiotically up-regulated gene 157 (Mug157) protein